MSIAWRSIVSMASILIFLIMTPSVEGGSLGLTFGRQSSQKLLPSMVVDLSLANGVNKMKLLSFNDAVLSAFARTNIEIFVSIPNVEMLFINSSVKAMNWVQRNFTPYITKQEVNIRYLTVSSEPFSLIETDKGDLNFVHNLDKNIKYVQEAIKADGHGDRVKVTVPHATDVLKVVKIPSESDFREDIKEIMLRSIKNLYDNGDPFTLNIYPLYSCINESYPIEFGLFDKDHNVSIVDGSLTYTNMFDFKYDSFLWALKKNGFGDMDVIVGHIGWPTDGHQGATVENAERFFRGFLKKVANDEGTPLRPNSEINAYIFSLSDENQRGGRGPFDRHYGIYYYDGTPKFNIDLSLRGRRDIKLETAKGVTYLPRRWCLLNKTLAQEKPDLVKKHYQIACSQGDCTPLGNGSSCEHLDEMDKVSYAFNSHFQMSNQDMSKMTQACTYEGLGVVVLEEPPRIGNCHFHVQILSTLFLNGQSTTEMQATLGVRRSSSQHRIQSDFGFINILTLFLCFYLPFWITLM